MPGLDPGRSARQLAASDGFAAAGSGRDERRTRAAEAEAAAAAAAAAPARSASTSTPVVYPPHLDLPALQVQFGDIVLARAPRAGDHELHGEQLMLAQAAWQAADRTDARAQIRRERLGYRKARKRPTASVDSARRVAQRRADSHQQEQNLSMCPLHDRPARAHLPCRCASH